jgi:hypothetical protein
MNLNQLYQWHRKHPDQSLLAFASLSVQQNEGFSFCTSHPTCLELWLKLWKSKHQQVWFGLLSMPLVELVYGLCQTTEQLMLRCTSRSWKGDFDLGKETLCPFMELNNVKNTSNRMEQHAHCQEILTGYTKKEFKSWVHGLGQTHTWTHENLWT